MTLLVNKTPILLGWREWISLPALGIKSIKAKLDTGARTSALHTFELRTYREAGVLKVAFKVHPLQNNLSQIVMCHAEVIDYRWVSDSGGHREKRYVIVTPAQLGKLILPIEVTLSNRETMRFRMLLGRSALNRHFAIHPGLSYQLTRVHKK